ncbi:iron dicitrate transport regulator FecR [Pedobacter sp. HMWF019]|uniref:FecR family protein n=1 Tax=Pedobacter sp. HMWF019 TaxID=2056856 RepID=UPI000D373572|nr:FecR family protein [Pedobacter sp. HMWF019]PTS94795.1 iron dicitrate transport regulator FecR [Pedobacter sp. HMWF019]
MDKQQAKELIQKYNQGLATAEEQARLENWYMQKSDSLVLEEDEINFDRIENELRERTFSRAGLGHPTQAELPSKSFKLWPRIASAAAVILIGGAALFYYSQPSADQHTILDRSKYSDINPGSNKAILTLANGQQISLTDVKNGDLAKEDHALIKKTAEGELVYQEEAGKRAESVYNMMSTPKGGQYSLTLADGSKVFLNAASSLKYPTRFKGKDRIVELTGEGYFEVAHNKDKPFKVISRGQTVEVLGTHFNINAYADEPDVKTTLLEGRVNVNGTLLKPNQQAVLVQDQQISVRQVDADEVVAWKDGLFKFDHTDIRILMRQIARWYDVDVVYEGPVKEEQFYGKIERSYTLSEVLKVLELGKVHFRIEGRKIIVMQ